jgi:hypothetical protein
MKVDVGGAFIAFQHKDAVFDGAATAGLGVRPAVGISSAGIGMGYNDNAGTWHNSIVIDATGNAVFAGTIAANSIITNTATINGVAVGTIQTDSSAAAIHAALTGNPHNVSLTQINGDLDDIDNGSTYFKTTSTQVTGAGRAANALDSSSDYIRSIQSTKIVVSAPNPTTGVVFDGAGIRMYQSGSLKVNIPVSGDPSFSGNITGGSDISITGNAIFNGNSSDAGAITSVLANQSRNQANGVRAYAGSSGGNAVYGNANNSGGVGYGAFFRRQNGASGAAVYAISSTSAPGLIAENDSTGLALQVTGGAQILGALDTTSVQTNSLRIDQTPTTGASTATFNANNKPGGNTTNGWLSISMSGTTKYIPVWS